MSTPGSEFLAIVYGLASGAGYGAGDFFGGLATRRSSQHSIIFIGQIVGAILLLAAVLIIGEPVPALKNLLLGIISGFIGGTALLLLYYSLSRNKMGIVSPVSAVSSAGLPVIIGLFIEGVPPVLKIFGFVLALIAVWFLSGGKGHSEIRLKDLVLPVFAGFGFGSFYILMDQVDSGVVLWPLVMVKVSAVTLVLILATIRRIRIMPPRNLLPLASLAGIVDACGTVFFVFATQIGRLDISAVLSSLHPAGTVFLAWFILKERLTRQQWIGVLFALLALVLIAK